MLSDTTPDSNDDIKVFPLSDDGHIYIVSDSPLV
jgi:hypothetical protein